MNTAVRPGGTPRKRLVTATRTSARTASGTKPIVNLLRQMAASGIGAVRSTHQERPSRLGAG